MLKILQPYEINNLDDDRIKKILLKKHLTHVPVTRKYNRLYSLYQNHHKGDIKLDKEFLDFYGSYRNAVHTNYIYHGNDKSYTFKGITYHFTNNEPISHSKKPDITDMFNLALELKSVCRRLFDSIQHPGLLEYPADKVVQPE